MKKTKLILAFLLISTLVFSHHDTTIVAEPCNTCRHVVIRDTVMILPHPNAQDSAVVVKTVNGVLQVINTFTGDQPLLSLILNNKFTSGGIVGLILAIWRRRELRKLKRKHNF